jgi:dihydroorotate dehydrogenase electron transfer subunit
MTSGRGTIYVEDAEVLAHVAHPDAQYVLRLHAPRCAASARPGSFVHLRCAPDLPMRRPYSIMRASASEGWIELLYKIVGAGSRALSARRSRERVSVLGPIGRPFETHRERPRALLIGGGVGIPPMIFLAEQLSAAGGWQPLVLMGSEITFPFELTRGRLPVAQVPEHADAALAALERLGVPSRLASVAPQSGCYRGYVTELARTWLAALDPGSRAQVEIYACGPTPMLVACARLARAYGLPCQVALEEFMACATGGCAGCAVRVLTPQGPAMKRVCVDGPVFDAAQVYYEAGD